MLIESKTTGQKYRALRLQYNAFITQCGEMIPADSCLILAAGIWWNVNQVVIKTVEHFVDCGIVLPEVPGPVLSTIGRVSPKPFKVNGANFRKYCVTPA